MTMLRTDPATERPDPPRASVARRVFSIISGLGAVGVFAMVVAGIVDVADIYGDAFGGGWSILWALASAVGLFLGGAAVVLWNPPRAAGVVQKTFFGVVGAFFVLFVIFFFVGPLF